jgi:hypothetical protein
MVLMASALHIHGIEHIKRVLDDMHYWLEKREYTSLWETRGCLSRRSVPDTSLLTAATTSRRSAPTACVRRQARSKAHWPQSSAVQPSPVR